jgi:hypothetical protein
MGPDGGSEQLEHPIAELMAEVVVGPLEMIEVENQDRDCAAGAISVLAEGVGRLEQGAPTAIGSDNATTIGSAVNRSRPASPLTEVDDGTPRCSHCFAKVALRRWVSGGWPVTRSVAV